MRMTLKALDAELKVSGILHCRCRHHFAEVLTGRWPQDFRNRRVLAVTALTALPESITNSVLSIFSGGVGDHTVLGGPRWL